MNAVKKTIRDDKIYCGAMVICDFCQYSTTCYNCTISNNSLNFIYKHCKKAIKKRSKAIKKRSRSLSL